MSITAAVRLRDRKIFDHISQYGHKSLRKTAQATGLTKDSVARGLAALSQRNKYPESSLWETEQGQTWLHRLVIATLYEFGIKGNLGADRISAFFKRIQIDTHVATSPNTLRQIMREIEENVSEFQPKHEKQQAQKSAKVRQIVASGDETFFNDKMLLVLMELSSGYLLMEQEAQDRTYDTWQAKAQARIKQLGFQVRHFISDRGKSLIKLATTAFGCHPGADIFHAQQDISKWLGRALYGQLGRACKQLNSCKQKLASLKEKEADGAKIVQLQERVEHLNKIVNTAYEGRQAYCCAQQDVSATVHAFSIENNKPQTSEQVEDKLKEQAQCFRKIANQYMVGDKKDTIGKFKRQIKDVSSIVDVWWLWTKESHPIGIRGEDIKQWLLYILLPVIYWHHQLKKTDSKDMKKRYEMAWRKAQVAYANHPVTATVSAVQLDEWRSWGEWACTNFQRASSAVEGRNGILAQSYHNGRGFTKNRLAALTTIHNYDTKRRDGSTPAQRLIVWAAIS